MSDRSFKKISETEEDGFIKHTGFAAINLTNLIDDELRLECFNYSWDCLMNGSMPHKGLVKILRPHLPSIEKKLLRSVHKGDIEYDEDTPPDVVSIDLEYFSFTVEHVLAKIISQGIREHEELSKKENS